MININTTNLQEGIGGSYRLSSLDRLAARQRILEQNNGLGNVQLEAAAAAAAAAAANNTSNGHNSSSAASNNSHRKETSGTSTSNGHNNSNGGGIISGVSFVGVLRLFLFLFFFPFLLFFSILFHSFWLFISVDFVYSFSTLIFKALFIIQIFYFLLPFHLLQYSAHTFNYHTEYTDLVKSE